MKSIQPLVSVCIPTYNNGKFIGKTIQSILGQTYDNLEIIIGDNASTDDTMEVVNRFNNSLIRYFRNEFNIGAVNNFNKCIKEATGEFIAIFHSDDIYSENIIEKESELLSGNDEIGAVFALDTLIDCEDNVLGCGVSLPAELANSNVYSFSDIYFSLLKATRNFLVCPTCVVRKKVFDVVGMFGTADKYGDWVGGAGDTELWLRIAERFKIGIINERLILRRISVESGSGQYNTTYVKRSNHFLVLDSFLHSKALVAPIPNNILRQYEFNKFWDDVIIARNMIINKINKRPLRHLLNAISKDRILTGLKSIKNISKIILYFGLVVASMVGAGEYLTRIQIKMKSGKEI